MEEDRYLGHVSRFQLLPPEKERDTDPTIIQTHVETLVRLITTREGRYLLREIKEYPNTRETPLHVVDDGVREVHERLVQVLMRDEEGEGTVDGGMKALERTEKELQVRLQADGRLYFPDSRDC